MTTIELPQTITVKVPSVSPITGGASPRATVVRAASQSVLNRSVPARNQSLSPPPCRRSRQVRTAPTGSVTATNEFTERIRSGRHRKTAKTSVVDFSHIYLQPTERRHVRGVLGFFPSSVLKSEEAARRLTQSPSCETSQSFSPPPTGRRRNRAAYPPPPRNDVTKAPTVAWQSPRADVTETQSGKEYQDILRRKPSDEEQHPQDGNEPNKTVQEPAIPPSPTQVYNGVNDDVSNIRHRENATGMRRRDAAWIKAYKVKQKRNNNMKDMLESRSTPNLQGNVFPDTFR